jgi:hypothetical protein
VTASRPSSGVNSILRYTVMNGAPLMVVAKNLGHADTRMAEKYYGNGAANSDPSQHGLGHGRPAARGIHRV